MWSSAAARALASCANMASPELLDERDVVLIKGAGKKSSIRSKGFKGPRRLAIRFFEGFEKGYKKQGSQGSARVARSA